MARPRRQDGRAGARDGARLGRGDDSAGGPTALAEGPDLLTLFPSVGDGGRRDVGRARDQARDRDARP